MRKGQKTSLEMQWAIVRLSKIIAHDDISMGLDVSTRTIRRVLSHFQAHGTIPECSDSAEKMGDESEKKPNRHLQDVDVEVCDKVVYRSIFRV